MPHNSLARYIIDSTCEFRYLIPFIFVGAVRYNTPKGCATRSCCACVDLTVCVAVRYLTLRIGCERYGRKNPLPYSFSKRSHIGNLRQIRKQGKGRSSKRKENRRLSFLFAPAAGAATLPPSADGESPAEVQRKTSRPERANPPAAVRAPRWVGAEKEPPRQGEHAYAVRMPRSPGAEKPCRRFVHRHIKAKPRFPSVFFFICGGANRSCDRLRGAHRPDGFRCPT